MELDLSSINRNMKNKFDLYIQKIWTESLANMGTGGLSNRSGANTPSSSSYGTSSSTTSNTQTSQTKPIFSKDKKNKMNVSSIDMDNMLLNPQTKLDDVLKDKDNQNSILTYISSSMSDPNYKNKEKIQNLIKNNKNLSDALSKFIIGGAK
jgi:hypothetical protein